MSVHAPISLLFVTATGTEVGKTVVSCLIADQLVRRSGQQRSGTGHQEREEKSARMPVGVLKPIATGESGDADELCAAARLGPELRGLVNPIAFGPPVAPCEALRRMGERAIDLGPVFAAVDAWGERADALVIEGLGGVLAPIGYESEERSARLLTVLDLIEMLGCPALVVADARLGTLNHTALTVMALRSRGIAIAGVVLNRAPGEPWGDESVSSNAMWIEAQCEVPVLAVIPELEGAAWDAREIDPALRDAIDRTDFRGLFGNVRRRAGE